MKNLCKIFAVGLIFVSDNSKLFATIIPGQPQITAAETDDFLNRSVDKVPGVPQPRPGTPDGGYRAEFYRKKAAAEAKKKLEQQRAAQQNPQPKAKKKIAAAKQFVDQNYVYQNPPKAAKKIGDAQKFAAQNRPSAAVPRAQQKIKVAQQFATQDQVVQPKSDLIRQVEADARQYRQEQDEAERDRILDLQRKLFLREELTDRDRADLIVFGITDPNDQRVSTQPTPPSAPAPQKPRRAKRVPVPERQPRELDPESREIQRRIVEFMRNWEGSTDDPFYIDAPSRITEEVMALQLNDQY